MINLFAFVVTYFIIAAILIGLYRSIFKAWGFVFLLPFIYGLGCAHAAHQASQSSSWPWMYVILGGILALGCFHIIIHDIRKQFTKPMGKAFLNIISLLVYILAYWLNIPAIIGM